MNNCFKNIIILLITVIVLSGCSRKNSYSENNEIENLLDFVENSSDIEFLGFLGSIGEYFAEIRARQYDEEFRKYLGLSSEDELPKMWKNGGGPNPEGIEIINQFHLYRFKNEIEKIIELVFESEFPELWETEIQYFSTRYCRYFVYYDRHTPWKGKLIEIDIPEYNIPMEGYIQTIHNRIIFDEIIRFEKEMGIKRKVSRSFNGWQCNDNCCDNIRLF